MMKKVFLASMLAVLAAGLLFPQPAAAAAPVTVNISQVDATAFPSVAVDFSAWDANGIPLDGLAAGDVFIQEDDGQEIHPDALAAEEDAVLSVVLVMDVSGSMKGQPLTDAQNAANRFLDKLNKKDQAAVIAFANGVQADPAELNPDREVGFASDLTAAFNLIEGLRADGGTEVYNAVEKAVRMASALKEGHRAVLLFTDGKNEPADAGDAENAIHLAKEANIPVFAIGLGGEIDESYLSRLTGETGGMYRLTPHSSELSSLFNQMAALLKTTYRLTYTSTLPEDGQAHTLKLRVSSGAGQGSVSASTGKLPKAALATAAPALPTATMEPSATTAPVQAAAAAAPSTGKGSFWADNWYWLLAMLVVIAAAVIAWRNRRRKIIYVEKCGMCGHELEGDGPCPMCQSTKRIRVKKE